jgi:NADH-quinone oxidoreductase subunit J
MNIELYFFMFFAVTALAAGTGMILQRNLVYSVLLLIMVMISLAGLFLMLNAQFVAVIQIVVYAGAIMVLFLFVIMLLNISREETGGFRVQKPVAVILLILLAVPTISMIYSATAGSGSVVSTPPDTIGIGEVEYIAEILFTKYLLPFEIAGVLLLIGIVGAVVLTKRGSVLSGE